MKTKIKTNLEVTLVISINKEMKDISVLSLDIIKNDLVQRLSDHLKKYRTIEVLEKDYPNIKLEQILIGSAKTEIII